MPTDFISVIDFCANYNIEIDFIVMLHENGLIEITTIEERAYVNSEQIKQLESFVRMYYELDINVEGIETINYLLEKIISLQDENTRLKNSLSIYEKLSKIHPVKVKGKRE